MNNYSTDYIYKQVDSKQITSDPTYQRSIDFARVKKIADHYNPDLVNPIKVSLRDGKYYVFDGQHTLAALKMRNGNRDLLVECKVYRGLTQQDEAILFSEQNGVSRAVTTNAKMKALYTAGDVEVNELYNAITSLGIKFDFSNAKGPYKIIACATVYKIFKKVSCSEFQMILKIVRDAWNGESESFNNEILSGMYVFYTTYKKDININKAIEQFGKVTPQQIIRNGKAYQEGGGKRFARQLVIAYNKNLRRGKLEELI